MNTSIDKKYLFLLEENKSLYFYSYFDCKVYSLKNSLETEPKKKNENSIVLASLFGAQIFPHMLRALNFDIKNSLFLKSLLLFTIFFISWIGGAFYMKKAYKKSIQQVRTATDFDMKELSISKDILSRTLKSKKILNQISFYFQIILFFLILLYILRGDLIWLVFLGVFSFLVSLLFGVTHIRGINIGNFVFDNKKSYELLRQLKKEGEF